MEIITKHGHYEFVVILFGLTNAPVTFNKRMSRIFAEHISKCSFIFGDDKWHYQPVGLQKVSTAIADTQIWYFPFSPVSAYLQPSSPLSPANIQEGFHPVFIYLWGSSTTQQHHHSRQSKWSGFQIWISILSLVPMHSQSPAVCGQQHASSPALQGDLHHHVDIIEILHQELQLFSQLLGWLANKSLIFCCGIVALIESVHTHCFPFSKVKAKTPTKTRREPSVGNKTQYGVISTSLNPILSYSPFSVDCIDYSHKL